MKVYVVGLEYSYEPGEHLGVNGTLEGAQKRAQEHYAEPYRHREGELEPLSWGQGWREFTAVGGDRIREPLDNWTAYGLGGEYWIALEEIGP